MKWFKIIDVWVSMVLMVSFGVASLVKQDDTLFAGYFAVGGWQVLSMIVHMINGWFNEKGGPRRIYYWVVVVIFAWALLGWLIYPLLFMLLIVLLFLSPFLAFWYTRICYLEVYKKMKRPLEELK